MIERKEIANEKTILIGTIKPGETDELIEEHLSELELLAETAGAEVIGKITQRISKINSALQRIKEGTYGFCEESGEPIGLKRLMARPVATLSIEAQERHERDEKIFVKE